jgi:hypothetical protein
LAIAASLSLTSRAKAEQAKRGCADTTSGPCSGLGGLFVYGGGAVWAHQAGLSLSFGLFHQYRFGFEGSVSVPLGATTGLPTPTAGLAGRLVLLREGLNRAWEPNATAPTLGLIVSLRMGVSFMQDAGAGSPIGLLIGPSFELLVGRTFLVGFRPSATIRLNTASEAGRLIPVEAFPMIDLSIGWVSESAYTR